MGSYRLESQEYYKIKVPWNNPYKKVISMPQGWSDLVAHLARITRIDGDQHWKDPNGCETLESVFKATDKPKAVDWYNRNSKRLSNIRDLAIALKTCTSGVNSSADLYFYSNAVFFALGLTMAFHKEFLELLCKDDVLCFCIDWSNDKLDELNTVFRRSGFSEFCKFLPIAFSVWTEGKTIFSSEYKNQFDQHAILLFDFMLECVLLANDTCKEVCKYHDNIAAARNQILSYYKHLKKHKIYLPKEIQYKIYRYL